MEDVKRVLINLGIKQLLEYYNIRNIVITSDLIDDVLDIGNNIWAFLSSQKTDDLGLFINNHFDIDELEALFWVYSICKCCNNHTHSGPKSLHSLPLITNIETFHTCECECNRVRSLLHYAYNYNQYHMMIKKPV